LSNKYSALVCCFHKIYTIVSQLFARKGGLGAALRLHLAGGRSMVREIWYRHLAIADRLIVEARNCMDSQKTHLSGLEIDGEGRGRGTALLGLLEETLQLMHSHRATILEKVAAYKSWELQ